MNRSFAAMAAAAMLAATLPTLSFAEEAATTTVESESSSSSSNDWQRPCDDLKGLLKAQCIVKHNPGTGNKKDRTERRNDDRALNATSKCKDLEGQEKMKCVRMHGKKGLKSDVRKAVKRVMLRTIRGKLQDESTLDTSTDE